MATFANTWKSSDTKGGMRNVGLNGQHPLCRLLCWATLSQCTRVVCSVLLHMGELALAANEGDSASTEGRNSVKVGVEWVEKNVQH